MNLGNLSCKNPGRFITDVWPTHGLLLNSIKNNNKQSGNWTPKPRKQCSGSLAKWGHVHTQETRSPPGTPWLPGPGSRQLQSTPDGHCAGPFHMHKLFWVLEKSSGSPVFQIRKPRAERMWVFYAKVFKCASTSESFREQNLHRGSDLAGLKWGSGMSNFYKCQRGFQCIHSAD